MSYIGNTPTSIAFLTDLFTGTGSLSVFTMSAAPDSTSSILVSITGVVQEPSTYSVSGNTLTFSQAPPAGTGNISIRYLGIPASGVVSTAYRTVTEFTATLAQTIFTVPSYTVGYITVYRNGVRLGTADYTATSGTNVILGTAANTGDLITTESFYVSSVLNAIPAVAGAITSSYILDGAVGTAEIASGVTLSSPNTSGNLNFSGTAQRITGDMSNATITNRLAFQTSTTNGNTILTVLPNGTSVVSGIGIEGDSAVTNGSLLGIVLQASGEARFTSGIRGTGTYLPITMWTGGSEKLRLDTSGNLLVGTTSASVPSTTGFVSSANTFGFKNRIINGNMAIDQRNAGASVTPTADMTYSVDRFASRLSQASKYSVQQVIDAPAGLYNSLKFTSLSAYTLTSTDFFGVKQSIEGNNWSDLDWGKATGVSATLSFWVKSSLTGTFGATMFAYTNGYPSYPFSYTITTANTWQQIVITIPAPPVTSGWGVGSAGCVLVEWSLGTGSTLKGTANTWNTTTIYRAATTENVSFVSNNAATWQITGVQLEKGSVATSFDYKPYGTELSLCQRYYESSTDTPLQFVANAGTYAHVGFKSTKRASPTVTVIPTAGTNSDLRAGLCGFYSSFTITNAFSYTASAEL